MKPLLMIPFILGLAGEGYARDMSSQDQDTTGVQEQYIPTNQEIYGMVRELVPESDDVRVDSTFAYFDPSAAKIAKMSVTNLSMVDGDSNPLNLLFLPTDGSRADSSTIFRKNYAPLDLSTGESNESYVQVIKGDTQEQIYAKLRDVMESRNIGLELNEPKPPAPADSDTGSSDYEELDDPAPPTSVIGGRENLSELERKIKAADKYNIQGRNMRNYARQHNFSMNPHRYDPGTGAGR